MPHFSFSSHPALVIAAREQVVGLSMPDLDVFNPHPIIDGIPAPELIQDFGVFG